MLKVLGSNIAVLILIKRMKRLARRVGRETFARIVDMSYCGGFCHEQYGLA